MKISVKLFAGYSELAGTKETKLEAQAGTTVAELKKLLKDYLPQLRNWDNNLVIAINSELADDNQILQEGDEIALLPPFSGG